MAFGALNEEAAAAVFLDFTAAFPSISQEYVQACLRHLGIPDSALNSFSNLYSRSRCRISMQGKSYDGFALQSGVRQGCPMSPIIYALVAEVLLDNLQSIDRDLLLRAYADDTAIVVRNLYETGPKLAEAFHEFEQVSGLKLNLRKSIIVALSNDDNTTDITRTKNLSIPRWAGGYASANFLQIFGHVPRAWQEEQILATANEQISGAGQDVGGPTSGLVLEHQSFQYFLIASTVLCSAAGEPTAMGHA